MTEQIKCCRTCKHHVFKLFAIEHDRCKLFVDKVSGKSRPCKFGEKSILCGTKIIATYDYGYLVQPIKWEPKDGN